MRLFLFIIYALVLMFMPSVLFANEQMRFQRLMTEQAGGQADNIGAITSIIEDPMGFIWFGGEQGLARYDGHALHIYRREDNKPNSLPRNFVRDIIFDRQQNMWVATSKGLVRYNPEDDDFIRFELNRPGDSVFLSSDVSSLAVDRYDNLIVGTHIGLAIIDSSRSRVEKFRHDPNDPQSLSDDYVRDVYIDSRNRLWVGTSKGGLNSFNADTKKFTAFRHNYKKADSIVDDDVRVIVEDFRGRIWVGTYGAGASRLNSDEKTFTNYINDPNNPHAIGAVSVLDIFEDSFHNLWFATDHGGLALYLPAIDGFTHYTHNDYNANSISSNHVRKVYEDKRGDLWVGTFPLGVNFYDRSTENFKNYFHKPDDPTSLSHNGVLTFFKTQEGELWVGTENGLNIFNEEQNSFERIYADVNDHTALQYPTILDVEQDVSGDLWVGTWSGGLHRYNPKTKNFKHYAHDPLDVSTINSRFVWRILKDSNNDIWVATENGGLNRYVRETDSFVRYDYDPSKPGGLVNGHVWVLFEDSRNNFWVGTLGGLQKFDRNSQTFEDFLPNSSDPAGMRGLRISAIVEDRLGRLWFATQDEGINIYSPREKIFQHIDVSNGLPTNEVASLQQDRQGNIWASTASGIVRIDLGTLSTRVFTKEHGLVGSTFNRDASFLDEEGYLYFGGTEGFSVFHPSRLASSIESSPIYINHLSILNRGETSGANYAPYNKNLIDTPRIELNYSDSVFSLNYSVLSYRSPNKNQYAYMLVGFDEQWHFVGNRNTATYTNLDPGEYIFKVKGANRDEVWSAEPAELIIRVLPPPWLTWWAYLLYATIFSSLLWLIWRHQVGRLEVKRERQLNARLLKVDRLKDAILENTSRELRGPLNNIMGLSECLEDGAAGELHSVAKEYIRRIVSNSRKLANYVDNVMEYSNLAGDESALVKKPLDIYSVIQNCLDSLSLQIREKNLELVNKVDKCVPLLYGDEARLQQVFWHLLQNAVQYTHSGTVEISSKVLDDRLQICIKDTGCGISADEQQMLFDPFFVGQDMQEGQSGMGLGLAVTKHLIDLHGGNIKMESEVGKGTLFWVELPLSEGGVISESSNENKRRHFILNASPEVSEDDIESRFEAELNRFASKCILVVDDDPVNRLVLTAMLNHYGFNALESKNAEEALDRLNSNIQVDLMIVDNSLPDSSGMDLCSNVRQSYSKFELPILFLTSRQMDKVLMEVYCAGGNDVLFKPVSKFQLLPSIARLLSAVEDIKRAKN